jgi:hypothetical protein
LKALDALPADCVRLIRKTSDSPRARAAASSEVISAEARHAASQSMSQSNPAPALLTYSAHASSAENLHPSTPPAASVPSVIVRNGPATGPIPLEKAPKQRAETTARFKKARALPPKKNRISTPTLYFIALMLFAIAVALWFWAMPR